MTTDDLIDIVIAPGNKIDEALIQKVAAILGLDPYHTRNLLASKIPKVIFQKNDPQKIEEIFQLLRTLGFVAFNLKDYELKKPISLFIAKSVEFTNDNIIFKDKNGQLFKLEKNNIFLILKGILRSTEETEVVSNIKRLSITATLMTGGIPINRTIQQKSNQITTQNVGLLRIFEKNSMDFCLEITQRSFNYSCLGAEMSPSSLCNINQLANKIRKIFPEAVFDDKLSVFPLNTSSSPLFNNIDINCKLLYLYYQAIKNHGSIHFDDKLS